MWDSPALKIQPTERRRLQDMRAHLARPICIGCSQSPDNLQEYREHAAMAGTTPADWVREHEGTLNRRNGHFLCTNCYIAWGEPSSTTGWRAP